MIVQLIWLVIQIMTFHFTWKEKITNQRISMILGFMIINVIMLAGGFYNELLIWLGWIQF
tara:strand:+ start:7729 stop:7908 length:180 start_codon:yes stop_codon:yes gene_type:complete